MNILLMADAVRARMAEIFDGFELPDGNPRPPEDDPSYTGVVPVTIYDGYAPKIRRAADGGRDGPELPFILVRPTDGTDGEGEGNARHSGVEVDIIIAARREEDDGYRDAAAIIQKIRTGLLELPYMDKKYRVELPLQWSIQEGDSYPQWFGLVNCRIIIPQPVELFPGEDGIYYGDN